MKKRKKYIAFILCVIFVISFAGCGSKKEPEKATMDLTQGEATAAPTQDTAQPGTENTAVNAVADGVNAYFANMPEDIYKIGQQEFMDKIKAGGDMVVIDIRSAEDYAAGHIKGAVNLPWGTAISDNIGNIPVDKEVYIYCYTGQTAGQAVMTMNLAGIPAKSVNLGWNLGISKVEGFESETETTANELAKANREVPAEITQALNAYYAGLAEVNGTTYANYKISEDALKEAMEAGEDLYILSVRSAEDYAKMHIEGAANIPWGKGMEQQFATLPKDKKIVVYCYTGQTAGQAVAGLRLLGYDAVSLNGGMGTPANAPSGWANKGYATVE